MPEGTLEWFGARRGCGFVPEGAPFAIATVARAGSRRLNEGQRLACDVTREQERCFSAVATRSVDQTGASVLSHVPGEPSGPLVCTIGLPDQPQSAGE
jgi:cold shock CspA family protein